MSRDELLSLIRRLKAELPRVRYVVLSGGEVTLLKQDLVDAVSLLSELGLRSRIVSNGHWAEPRLMRNVGSRTWSQRADRAESEHRRRAREWVPVDSVARAALHAAQKGLLTVIMIEGSATANFARMNSSGCPTFARSTPIRNSRSGWS